MGVLRFAFFVIRLLIVIAIVIVLSPLILVGLGCWLLVGSLGDDEDVSQRQMRTGR
jgi:hypothetical protein